MGFGNSKTFLLIFVFLLHGNSLLQAQQQTKTSDFLYDQLAYFLQNPSHSGVLQLSTIVTSKEHLLTTKTDQLAWVIINCNMGYYYNQFGNKPTAILYYEKAWKTYYENSLDDYDIIENCLQPLGNMYIQIGDLPKAESTITNYLYLAEQSQNTPKIISGFTNLSIAYHNQGNYPKAIEVLTKGLEIDPNNVNILTNLATNYLDTGNFSKAEGFAKKVIAIAANKTNAYQILAAISLEKKEIQEAQNYMLQAKSQLLKEKNTTARSLCKWQLAYIDILLSQSEFTEVQKNLNEIYGALLPRYSEKSELPPEEHLIADRILLKALDVQAYVYEQTKKPILAIKTYDLAFEVNSKLNTLYPLQDTRIIQHSQNRNRTEACIDLLFIVYESTKNTEYIQRAFQVAEHSKAPFVNEALISKQLLSQYRNDPLVIQKDSLGTAMASYETLILKEKLKGNNANIAQIQKWSEVYDTKSIDLKELIKKLQNKYSKFLQAQKKIPVKELQKKLNEDNTTMVTYFYGNQSVYQFKIHSDFFEIEKIENTDHFKNVIKNYIHYFDTASGIINDIPAFTKSAAEIFSVLKIPQNTKRLLIVPDGFLSFIPFETLLTEETNALNFGNMPFLLRSTEVSYEISASKYLRSAPKDHTGKTVLGVFPVFENTDIELPFSLAESELIQQYFEGAFLEKEQATYDDFIQKSKDHTIIHLSTHAEAGSFFRPASIKFRNQDILVNQLYALQLDTDLVVLSACETGVGRLAKGEGPISIGRGFQYAGVENVLFSLWKVNDKTTSRLMGNFYNNLHELYPRAKAIHQAKLDYLDAQDIANVQKSPYYWAAFVYYGQIKHTADINYLWYSIGLVLFLLIVLLLRKFLQNKT